MNKDFLVLPRAIIPEMNAPVKVLLAIMENDETELKESFSADINALPGKIRESINGPILHASKHFRKAL